MMKPAPLSIALLLAVTGLFAEPEISGDDIRFVLDAAAAELDWVGQVQTIPLGSGGRMFLLRDSAGMMAVSQYASPEEARDAFASTPGGEKETFHGCEAVARGNGSLTWFSETFVFSTGSGGDDARGLGELLVRTAAEGGLLQSEAGPPDGLMSGNPEILSQLAAEYSAPLPAGVISEAAEMAGEIYGIDYRDTVARAASGDEGQMANLFTMTLDGAAAETHAEVLSLLREGMGAEAFDGLLGTQSGLVQNAVNQLIALHAENHSPGLLVENEKEMEAGPPGETDGEPEMDSEPIFLRDGLYESYQTPAQVTYYYVIDSLFRGGNVSRVGSPDIEEKKVTIDFVLSGQSQDLWFVEKHNDGTKAEVVVGPPNAGGDLYRLKNFEGRWAIMGIEEADGI